MSPDATSGGLPVARKVLKWGAIAVAGTFAFLLGLGTFMQAIGYEAPADSKPGLAASEQSLTGLKTAEEPEPGSRSESTDPTKSPTPTATPSTGTPAQLTFLPSAVRVIDGDTLDVSGVGSVRLIGIDTPERGQCGYDQATANLRRLVSTGGVVLVPDAASGEKDKYGRLLRFVEVNGADANLAQIASGYAKARYDGLDGYGRHARQDVYRAKDAAVADYTCVVASTPRPAPTSAPAPAPVPAPSCDSNYSGCVPVSSRDLDCPDIGFKVRVLGTDRHGFDRDGDGWGCESYG